ncbi:MAG: HAMP domain-containing histidine kinase [Sedimentisphaerales bacterium]|nr:HAMP domain-containing histidine kinase [Sedimentisphaerales bacterium]
MASITEKRLSLHRCVKEQKHENEALRSQLTNIQHLANTGTISHMIAHEINNLLTPLRNYAAVALENPDDKHFVEKALQKTVRNCERASNIMESMLAMANGQTQEKKNVRLLALVEEIFTCLCRDFSKDGITVEIIIPEDLKIGCVPVQIQQVIMNLILNARDAMLSRGGILQVKATETEDSVRIEVSDTGEGIDTEDLINIFDSFFTTKTNKNSLSEHSGTGLGLAFCKKIIEEHEGLISVESKSTKGSKFTITLPKSQQGSI